jgi:DNA-directed RNA polymerase subunit RPC12/RpoP
VDLGLSLEELINYEKKLKLVSCSIGSFKKKEELLNELVNLNDLTEEKLKTFNLGILERDYLDLLKNVHKSNNLITYKFERIIKVTNARLKYGLTIKELYKSDIGNSEANLNQIDNFCKSPVLIDNNNDSNANKIIKPISFADLIAKNLYQNFSENAPQPSSSLNEQDIFFKDCEKNLREEENAENNSSHEPTLAAETLNKIQKCNKKAKTFEEKCKICEKPFSQKSNLDKHMRIHTGVKPYKCATCKMSFSQKIQLIRHSYNHSGIKPYNCHECGKSFTDKWTFKRHTIIHTGIIFQAQSEQTQSEINSHNGQTNSLSKSFSFNEYNNDNDNSVEILDNIPTANLFQNTTEIPSQSTSTSIQPDVSFESDECIDQVASNESFEKSCQPNLSAESISTEEKINKLLNCEFCDKSFIGRHRLISHLRTHTVDKPNTCSTCKMSFSQKVQLIRHESIHTGITPFNCEECGKSFCDKRAFKRHKDSHCKATKL